MADKQVTKTFEQATVDLTTCEWERIHIPGRVQSHGVLVIDKPSDITYIRKYIKEIIEKKEATL